MADIFEIAGRIHSTSQEEVTTVAGEILDENKGKKQSQINTETDAALADRYTKSETYNKTELDNMITTPNQEYVTVTATNQTTAVTDVLPATGAADTTYRVGNWNGTQYNDSVFSEYAWNGSAYIKLSTKSQVGEVYDISANHADTKYADLAAALNGGANIPQELRRGGMSVKFVQSIDNKYVQFRLTKNTWSTDTSDWALYSEDVLIESPEYIHVETDKKGKILWAIKANGSIYWGAGVPQQVINYVTEKIEELSLGEYEDIVAFLGNLITGDKTLQELLNEKVAIVEGKSLIDSEYADSVSFINNPEFDDVVIDLNGKIIESSNKKGVKDFPNLRLFPTEIIICGSNASAYQLNAARYYQNSGFGIICNTDTEVNAFIEKFKGVKTIFKFYGTIICAHGIVKYPEHNLIGYGCTLKMGDNLGDDYWTAIMLRPNGNANVVTGTTHYWCSHNHTCIKGFYIDGNAANNCEVVDGETQYRYKGIYGPAICFENYDVFVREDVPSSTTCTNTNVIVEDITAVNTMRGIVLGVDIIARNLFIENSYNDHALYIAGSSRTVVENIRIKGYSKLPYICISPQMWLDDQRVQNVILRNIYVYNPHGTLALEVRGHFSDWTNNQALNNIIIDGFYVKSDSALRLLRFGTQRSVEVSDTNDFPYNIVVKNALIKATSRRDVIDIYNANVNFEDCVFDINWTESDKSFVTVEGKNGIKNSISFINCRLLEVSSITSTDTPFYIFRADPDVENNIINGINIDGLTIEGNTNYYLFGASEPETEGNKVIYKNVVARRLDATPLGTINPLQSDSIEFTNDYYSLNN